MSSETSNASQNEPSKELQEQLIVAEYNQCRNALIKNIELMDRSETFFLSAAAAVFAYSSSVHKNLTFGVTFKVLPLLILLAGLLRFFVLDKAVGYYNDYLAVIENKYKMKINNKCKNILDLTNFFRRKNKKRLYWYRLIPYYAAISLYSIYLSYFLHKYFILLSVSASIFLVSMILLVNSIFRLICIESEARSACGCGHASAPSVQKCLDSD